MIVFFLDCFSFKVGLSSIDPTLPCLVTTSCTKAVEEPSAVIKIKFKHE